MPPFEGIESGGVLTEYAEKLDGGAAVKVVKGPQFGVKDFKAVKPLGGGDMGNVFLVAQRTSNAPYAMKVMRKDVLKKRENEHRALAERDILRSVNHPFLPVLHSDFENETHMFLVMSYCHAGDLNVLRHSQPEKRFSESAVRFYATEVILALEYLHKRNVVYRDLKPENILIQSGGHIMLTDFDLSLDLSERKMRKSPSVRAPVKGSGEISKSTSTTPRKLEKLDKKSSWKVNHVKAFFACGSPMSIAKQPSVKKKAPKSKVSPEEIYRKGGVGLKKTYDGPAHSFVGTEEYVAPEIIWSRGHGLPVDWWTLGVLLYELYYGKTPFKGVNRKETFYNVLCRPVDFRGPPSPLTDLIRKLLTKEPENRLGTKGGADEIKNHSFFRGVNWDANELQQMSRTPVVPDPFSWEQIEKDRAAKMEATGKVARTKWSFNSSDVKAEDLVAPKSPSGPLSLKNNDSSDQDRFTDSFISKHFVGTDSTVSSPRSVKDEERGVDAFELERRDSSPQLQIANFKEEIRLERDDATEKQLFEDVF